MSVSGIYQIENVINNMLYVGSAVDLRKRKIHHLSALKRGNHVNSHLQRAYRKYGSQAFTFSVIEFVENKEELIEREQFHIDRYDFDQLYNIAPTAGSFLGVKHSDETRQRLSVAHKGKTLSDDHRQRLSVAAKGKTFSEETRQRLSEAHKGKPKLEDAIKKTSEAKWKPVNKICKQTLEILQVYPSLKSAAFDNGITNKSISNVITGRAKSAGGFGWSLAE